MKRVAADEMNPLDEILLLSRVLNQTLPEAVEQYRQHGRQAELLRRGLVEKMYVEGGKLAVTVDGERLVVNRERVEVDDDVTQQRAWHEVIMHCRRNVDTLTRLLVIHMPDTAKRCPMMEFTTPGGPDYTRPNFDIAEFRRQCREVELDAASAILKSGAGKPQPRLFHSGHNEHEGEWSKRAPLADLAAALDGMDTRTFKNQFATTGLIQKTREAWRVRLDNINQDDCKRIKSFTKGMKG